MDFDDIYIKCSDRDFTDGFSDREKIMTLEEVLDLCDEMYNEIEELKKRIEEIEQDVEDNYRPIPKAEQYDVKDEDFI